MAVDENDISRILDDLSRLTSARSGDAREYPGDTRDDGTLKALQKIMVAKGRGELPGYLFKPQSEWTDEDKIKAEEDPSMVEALDVLHALQEETNEMSDEFLGLIWLLRQVDPGFKALTDLDEKGRLPYAGPCVGMTPADIEKAHLPEYFLNAGDFALGRSAFYATVIALKLKAQLATLDAMEAAEKKTSLDPTFIDAARAHAVELLEEYLGVEEYLRVGTRYAGHSDRNALVRLLEKMKSMQLFGRHARAAVGVITSGGRAEMDADGYRDFLSALPADGADDEDDDWFPALVDDDDDTLSYVELRAAVKSGMDIFNKIIATKRVIAGASLIVGDAYEALGRGFSHIEQDFEAFIAAATGCMIERGGTNVAPLGCLPKKDKRRCEVMPLGRGAFRVMMDDAFIEMKRRGRRVDAFDEEYTEVKGKLAKDVFAKDPELLCRLAALDALVKKDGVRVLAAADAEALEDECAALPTYDTMDAGMFRRALCAAAGRVGGRKSAETRAEMFDEYFSGDASPKVVKSVETWLNGMGWRTPEEHRDLSEAGGGTPLGGFSTKEDTDGHRALSAAAGGSPLGGYPTKEGRDGHITATVLAQHAGRKRRAAATVDPAEYGSVGVGATRGAPGSASENVADPEPVTPTPTPAVSPAGGGARRGRRFIGAKKDPTSVRGTQKFIALGVRLICSKCETTETSVWSSDMVHLDKPLAATRGDCADCGIAGADVPRMCKSKSNDGAWLCEKCRAKEASSERVCPSCEAGVETVSSWRKSKHIEGAPLLCNVCYGREATEILTAAGTTCGKCGSSKTSTWGNSPDVPGGKVCMKCWKEDDRASKKKNKK